MAIYSLQSKPASRSNGKNAIAMAAYRCGGRLIDQRTGQICDYTHKSGVIENRLVFPRGVKFDRQELWNLAEQAEKRKDSRIAREILIALPHEISQNERKNLVNEFVENIVNQYGIAVDVSWHQPDRQGDQRNFHAHLLLTTRQITSQGFSDKSDLEKCDKDLKKAGKLNGKDQLISLRENWENLCNRALERSGIEERISAKSYKSRHIPLQPTIHLGPAVTAMERKGIETENGTWNRIIKKLNLRRIIEQNIIKLQTFYDSLIATKKREFEEKIAALKMERQREPERPVQTAPTIERPAERQQQPPRAMERQREPERPMQTASEIERTTERPTSKELLNNAQQELAQSGQKISASDLLNTQFTPERRRSARDLLDHDAHDKEFGNKKNRNGIER